MRSLHAHEHAPNIWPSHPKDRNKAAVTTQQPAAGSYGGQGPTTNHQRGSETGIAAYP